MRRLLFFIIVLVNAAFLFPQDEPSLPAVEPEQKPAEAAVVESEKVTRIIPRARPFASFGGSIFVFVEDAGIDSDPMPILPLLYINISYPLKQVNLFSVYLGLSVDVYSTQYLWSDTLARPLPAAAENRKALVFGIPVGLNFEMSFCLTEMFTLRANFGVSADLRLTLLADGLNDEIDDIKRITLEKEKIAKYFWRGVNWLFYETALGVNIKLLENYSLGIGFRAFIPFNQPPLQHYDSSVLGWRFGGSFRIMRLL